MKTRVVAPALLCACPILAAAAAPLAGPSSLASQNARGVGTIRYGHDEESVGMFDFDLSGGEKPAGTLLYAGEDHHGYPHVIVRLEKVLGVEIDGRTVELKGSGTLNGAPVSIEATGIDKLGPSKDAFKIECVDGGGKVLLHARGEVFLGGIQVGDEE